MFLFIMSVMEVCSKRREQMELCANTLMQTHTHTFCSEFEIIGEIYGGEKKKKTLLLLSLIRERTFS